MTAQAYTERNQREEHARQQLLAGIERLESSDDWIQVMTLAAKLRSYSFNNVMLLAQQADERGIELQAVMGYQAWRKLGRQVRKGEQAMWVIAPVKYKAEDRNGDEYMRVAGFKLAPVFEVSQTMGDPLPEFVTTLDGDAPSVAPLVDYIENELKFQWDTGLLPGQIKGMTRFSTRAITINAATDAELFAVTLHEIGHAMLHDPKLDPPRDHTGIGEVQAESFAYMAGQALGLDTEPASFGYIAEWAHAAGRKPSDVVTEVGTGVVAAVRKMLDWMET